MLNLNCVICAELFSHSDDVHITTCGHMFHFTCLRQWLDRSKSCPQCRNKCTDRNIFRVYFNLANLDVSHIDVGSLQEQLDNAKLQVKIKEKDVRKAEEQVKSLKEIQKKCMKTIAGLEQKLQKNDFLILTYTEQLKILKTDAKIVDDLRKEVKSLKSHIETMEGVSSILTATYADAEKLLKNENDPKMLSVWVTTLKRELRHCENKKTDLNNVLKVVQSDFRKEIKLKTIHEERISQLESDNYQLLEKIKTLENANTKPSPSNPTNTANIGLNNSLLEPLIREDKRLTISPTIKANIKKIEESNSPYLNIKSSSVGLEPLLKRKYDMQPGTNINDKSTSTLTTIKISPIKRRQDVSGVALKTSSALSEKYSIFKKPRIGIASGALTGSNPYQTKPLGSNFVFDGFGGSEKLNPFANNYDEDEEEENARRARKQATSTVPKSSAPSLSNRLKTGGLRNFKVSK